MSNDGGAWVDWTSGSSAGGAGGGGGGGGGGEAPPRAPSWTTPAAPVAPPSAPSWTQVDPGPSSAGPGSGAAAGAGAYGGPGPFHDPRAGAPGGYPSSGPAYPGSPPPGAGPVPGSMGYSSPYGSPPPGASRGVGPHTTLAKLKDDALKSIYIGVGVIALFASITIGTFIFAPGGRFFVLFGPILLGAAQIKKGTDQLSHVRRVEREQAYAQPRPPGW